MFSNLFKCCYSSRRDFPLPVPTVENIYHVDLNFVKYTNNDYYDLDNFYKNAMLIFCQINYKYGSRDREQAMADVEAIANTFQKHRFIVDTHVNLTSEEIKEKCISFFSQDFFEYGAVAVVIIAPSQRPGVLVASDDIFHENIFLKYLTTDAPPSLKGKPKIYITEANISSVEVDMLNSILVHNYEDILALQLPSVDETKHVVDDIRLTTFRPLYILCQELNDFGNNGDLLLIVKNAIRAIKNSLFLDRVIISTDEEEYKIATLKQKLNLICTFRKRLIMPTDMYVENNSV